MSVTVEDLLRENRIGEINIDTNLIYTMTIEEKNELFKDLFIVKAENLFQGYVKYVALSEKFDKAEDGSEPPLYNLTVEQDEEGNKEVSINY